MKRQRKKYFNTYQAYRGKSRWKKIALWVLAGILVVLLAALGGWLLTGGELSALPFPWK